MWESFCPPSATDPSENHNSDDPRGVCSPFTQPSGRELSAATIELCIQDGRDYLLAMADAATAFSDHHENCQRKYNTWCRAHCISCNWKYFWSIPS